MPGTGTKHQCGSVNGDMTIGFGHLMDGGDPDKRSFIGVVRTDACLNWDQERKGVEKRVRMYLADFYRER